MTSLVAKLALRAALCLLLGWLGWKTFGPIGLLFGGAALGLALPSPLLNLGGELRRVMRARVWRDLEGRHYAFRGLPVQVLEDVSHRRWVRAADVRAIVGFTATEGALALTYPQGFCRFGKPAQAYFSDEALLLHLAKEPGATALRFRHWVEREIGFPARRQRERLGVRLEAPDADTTE